ncbi:hypothetical protein CBR_g34642 [Chara braunii]|uniref:Myb-like domain-containing protein n=1 Tax=Chara braunii TaxID=69332 RepID=A0A388LJ67_CHABU|nr:hypothetical protein CBR_g34642 [Chara braunii]|eukprot:GBG82358.1 hypothetical protein CBR_g34642 [Chara braunii]
MAGMKARAVLRTAEGRRRPATTEPSRRYDPSMYSHRPSWETPLPPSDEEPEGDELPTFPLASGSTQLLSQTVLVGGSASNERGEYTSLLQQGLGDDDDDGGVDLRFGLSSGGAREASRTVFTAAHASARGLQQPRRVQTEPSTVRGGATVAGGVGSSPAARQHVSSAPSGERLTDNSDVQLLPQQRPCAPAVHARFREEVEAGDDDDDNAVRPVGKTGGRSIGRSNRGGRGRSVGRGGRGGITDDGGKSATYWLTDEQMLLEWKWVDIAKRMANGGSPKDADDCMKKWDNLFQDYKKIQRFQNMSGRPDFFKLSNDERKEHNFKFRMERVLYNEIHSGMLGNHTIFPSNIANAVSPDGVQLPRRGAGGGSMLTVRAVSDDDFETEEPQAKATASAVRQSARQRASDHSASKRMRSPAPEAQQARGRDARTDKVVVVVAEGDDNETLERRRQRNLAQAAAAPLMTTRLPEKEVVPERRAIEGEVASAAGGTATGNLVPVATAREEAAAAAAVREDTCGEKTTNRKGGDVGPSWVRKEIMSRELIDRAVLWVDDKAFWMTGEGRRFDCRLSQCHPAEVEHQGSQDLRPSQLQQAISRAATVENVALRVLHDWVFKSGTCARGYNLAFQYALESVAMDIARAMWYGENWSNVVSAPICGHTIDLNMDLPLWFASAHIDDRPDDDDMAAYQESTVICIAQAFRAAVQMGAHIDNDFISYDRLCRVADCFRLLLAATMWIMRLAGDDSRSHYEAFYSVNLLAKPTLVASMHRSFDHRRSVVRAVKVVTKRLGKENPTFGEHPDYIPQWAPCGITFGHDASLTGPEDCKRLDWVDPPMTTATTTRKKARRGWGGGCDSPRACPRGTST